MICPGGIFSPVLASLLKSNMCKPLLSLTQLKTFPNEAQALADGAMLVAALAKGIRRICW